jgi:hypothetical protein
MFKKLQDQTVAPPDQEATRNDDPPRIWVSQFLPKPTTLLKRFTSQLTSPPWSVCAIQIGHLTSPFLVRLGDHPQRKI